MTPLGWTCLGAWAGLQIGVFCGLWIATPRRPRDEIPALVRERRRLDGRRRLPRWLTLIR